MSAHESSKFSSSTSSLRSQLSFYLPDLRDLALIDLQECKWKTRKNVFRALLSGSPVLKEECSRMESLLTARTEEMSKLSAAETARPARIEAEQLFKNRFMDIVLSALISLAWPPALEAFSNPLPALNTQINTVHAAMLYILEKGIAPHSTESYGEYIEIARKEKVRVPKPGWKGVLDDNGTAQSVDSSRPSSSSSVNSTSSRRSSASRQLRGERGDEIQSKDPTTSGKSSTFVDSDDGFFSGFPQKISGTPQRKSRVETTKATSKPLSTGLTIDLPSSSRSSRADSIISDLNSEQDSFLSARSSKTAMQQPNTKNGDDAAPGSAGSGACNCAISCEISRSMEMLQFQNQSLSKQLKFIQSTIAARNEAEMKISILIKDLMQSVKEVYEISNSSEDFGTEEEVVRKMEKDSNKSRLGSANSSSSSSMGRREKLKAPVVKQDTNPPNLWKSIYSKISDVNTAWIQATNDARKAAFSSIDAHRTTSHLFGGNKSSSSAVKIFDGPSKIVSHRIFGVQPAIDTRRDKAKDDSNENTGTYGLDLLRIHQLQRDLLQYNSLVEAHIGIDDLEVDEDNVFDFPTSAKESRKVEKIQNMKTKGFQLILHLAALTPLASLSSEDHKSSSLFGLEQLLIELQKEDGKERFPIRIQQTLERARNEHIALVNCYLKSLSLLNEWALAAKRFSEKLNHDSNPHELSKVITYAESVETNIHTLLDAFEDAGNARIATSKEERSVPPMDMLSRGYMGEEMANLVNTIRVSVESLRDLFDYTQEIKEGIQSKVSKDRLKKTNIARDLHNASKIATEYAEDRSPSNLYNAVKGKKQQQKTSYRSTRNSKTAKSPSGNGASVKSRPEFSF